MLVWATLIALISSSAGQILRTQLAPVGPERGVLPPNSDFGAVVLLCVLALSLSLWLFISSSPISYGDLGGRSQLVWRLLSGSSFIVIAGSLWWPYDRFGMWQGFNFYLLAILVGALTIVHFVSWPRAFSSPGVQGPVVATLIVFAVLISLASLETPGSIRDEGHFEFTAEELSYYIDSEAKFGERPHQYSYILGLVIAYLLRESPASSVTVILWFVWLQKLIIAALPSLVFASALKKSKRTFGFFFAFVSILSAMLTPFADPAGRELLSVGTYFQTTPMRLFLPIVLFTVFLFSVNLPPSRRRLRISGFSSSGVLSGAAIVNNPDFGLAACLVATLLLLGLLAIRYASALETLVYFLGLGALLGSAFLVASGAAGINRLLYFNELFGSGGYLAEPMDIFGPHIAFWAIFVFLLLAASQAIGLARHSDQNRAIAISLPVLLYSGYGLVIQTYFASRSLAPTLISSSSVVLVVAAVVSIPMLSGAIGVKGVRQLAGAPLRGGVNPRSVAVMLPFFVSLIFIFGAIPSLKSILAEKTHLFFSQESNKANADPLDPTGWGFLDARVNEANVLFERGNYGRAIAPENVAVATTLPSLVSRLTGSQSILPITHPAYLSQNHEFARLLCQEFIASSQRYLLISEADGLLLMSLDQCRSLKKIDWGDRSEASSLILLDKESRKGG